jgi:transmembrane sensor
MGGRREMNDNERDAAVRREAIEDKAVEWVILLRGDDAKNLKPRFDAWKAESPEHQAAYEWAKRHFETSASLKISDRHGISRFIASRKWEVLAVAAVIALVLLFRPQAVFAPFQNDSETAWAAQRLETPHGAIRTYGLSDGSKVTLDSSSGIEFAMTKSERRVKLHEGRARFEIARENRPFVVEAGSGVVSTAEGVLDIGFRNHDQVEVDLVSGQADVRPLVTDHVAHALAADWPFRYSASAFRPTLLADDGINRRDWPSGWVTYRAIALADLVDEVNRYAAIPVVIDDEALGRRILSGRFKLNDTDGFVRFVGEWADLQIVRRPGGIHLQRR